MSFLNISLLLSHKIQRLQTHELYLNTIKKTLTGPTLLCVSSICLNVFLFVFFIPQMTSLLSQFNATTPQWITLSQDVIGYLILYWPPLIVLGLLCGFVFRRSVFHWIFSPLQSIKHELFIGHFFSLLESYLQQGVELITLVKSISIASSPFKKELAIFKNDIVCSHSYQCAFERLLNNPSYFKIIEYSISINQLQKGLSQIQHIIQQRHDFLIKKFATIIKIIATLLTGFNILFGFYISIFPMTQIIEKLLIP